MSASVSSAAGIGGRAPSKCNTTDVDYYIDNIVPSGVCALPTDTIQIDFDVFIWGNPTRYNFTTGYTLANDAILQDIECLSTGVDIDGTGCDDYNGGGSSASPFITNSFFDVACDLDGNGAVDPVLAIDLYVNMSTKSGDTGLEIDSPKCKVQSGNTIPLLPASLTLEKIVVNDNNGIASVTDWILNANIGGDAAELSGASGATNNLLAAGDYLLSEAGPVGYTMTGLTCDSGVFDSATNTLTLAPGDVVQCSFTNDDDYPAEIKLTKQVSSSTVQPGSVVTYQVTVENVGNAEARNIFVTDILSSYLTYMVNTINGGDTADDSDPAGSGLSWSIATMQPGTVTTLSFQAMVGHE